MTTTTLLSICAIVALAGLAIGGGIAIQSTELRHIENRTAERVSQAQSRLEDDPNKAKPAWDLARITLEAYFQRNLSQITCIFWLSAAVMAVGFGIVIWGITQAVEVPKDTTQPISPANLGILTGLITQFIGGSFLLLYRSILGQASNYAKTLERINSIGMAMQIMDTIPEEAKAGDLKSQTKVTIAQMLVQQSYNLPISTAPEIGSNLTASPLSLSTDSPEPSPVGASAS